MKKQVGSLVLKIIMIVFFISGAWICYNHAKNQNIHVNNYLSEERGLCKQRIKTSRKNAEQCRVQLGAINDQNLQYLMHHPKLKNYVQLEHKSKYIKIKEQAIKVGNEDHNKIREDNRKIDNNENKASKFHNHPISVNVFHPMPIKAYNQMAVSSASGILALIVALAIFAYTTDDIRKLRGMYHISKINKLTKSRD